MTNLVDEIDTVLEEDYVSFLLDDDNPHEIVELIIKREEEQDGLID